MTCPACIRAKTDPHCADVRRGCEGCGIREIARMPKEKRQAFFDAYEKKEGEKARRELSQTVREEFARIQALKGIPA